ncbi:hypothetical protein CH330_06960 [candidate division WOR-3 bacterium JGI_Cruoil_03_51_56]|uniref:Cytochrome b561 domain-containing protein n=1 Tax=candidate division WOR-3 bacterium JGI_Cruoil_03_51_56 TaxID=1973747 RepID=A0A235BRW9_UNCW3|nr:MAG: hypothetical protein CH330_06960 [candidate division WOR-3 bacterium JGI_Cruoil_03_51_56]
MPWYGFIHPALAIITMIYGVIIAQTSVSRLQDWNYPLRKQRSRSIVFFVLCIANLVLGYMVSRAPRIDVKLTFHLPMAIIVSVLALFAMIATFTRSTKPGKLSPFMHWHPWFIIIGVVFTLTMGFIGLLAAFGI